MRLRLLRLLAGGCAIAATAMPLASQPAGATVATAYVAPSGSDSANSCASPSAPCASVTHALSQLAPGGTVYVAGTLHLFDNASDPGDANGISVSENATIAQQPGGATAVLEGTGDLTATAAEVTIAGPDDVSLVGLQFVDANNYANYGGGAITNDGGGNVTVSDSTFVDDQATNAGSAQTGGGAIANASGTGASGTLSVTDSTFSDDYSRGDAGALSNGDFGGTGTATVTDSTFSDNSAYWLAGAIANGTNSGTGTITIDGSTFIGNTSSTHEGGALDSGDDHGIGTATVTDSTFSDNGAWWGGAISQGAVDGGQGTLVLVGDTFLPESSGTVINSGYQAGGERSRDALYAAGNLFVGACYGDVASSNMSWTDGGYNASTDSSCLGSTPAPTDAPVSSTVGTDIGSLANNGGSTETALIEAGNPASGLIPANAGPVLLNGTSYQLCPALDQRGDSVPFGAPCNAGAVQDTPVVVTVSGSQISGTDTPTFSYSTVPSGVAVTDLTCSSLTDGSSISANLAVGTYTLLGSSCSGAASPGYLLTYTGASDGYSVVAPVMTAPPPLPALSPSPGAPAVTPPARQPTSVPPAVPALALSASATSLPAHGAVLALPIMCARGSCIGVVHLTVERRTKHGLRQLLLATGSYSLSAGSQEAVTLHETRSGEAFFARQRSRWRVTATITARGGHTLHHALIVKASRRAHATTRH